MRNFSDCHNNSQEQVFNIVLPWQRCLYIGDKLVKAKSSKDYAELRTHPLLEVAALPRLRRPELRHAVGVGEPAAHEDCADCALP